MFPLRLFRVFTHFKGRFAYDVIGVSMFNPWKNALTSRGFSLLYVFLDLQKSSSSFCPSGGVCLTSSPEVLGSRPGSDTFLNFPLTLIRTVPRGSSRLRVWIENK
jgi:hypothetical protein